MRTIYGTQEFLENQQIIKIGRITLLKIGGDIHYENQRSSFEITTNAADFEIRIDFDNEEGRLFTSTLQDMLFHIINHSTHHRSQIAMNFRDNELEPLSLDYIFYKR